MKTIYKNTIYKNTKRYKQQHITNGSKTDSLLQKRH